MIKIIDNKYQILRKLAKTNDAEIFLVMDLTDANNGIFAIKTFKVDGSFDVVEMYFKRECEVLELLRHQNIVNILNQGFDRKNRILYIVLEYVEGDTLENLIKENLLIAYDKDAIIEQIFAGIDYAHSQNVLHRDIKPSNIMITRDGVVKLIDFGISKIIDSLGCGKDQFTIQSLTYKYASPEQKLNKSITFQSDIYSLGLVLTELLENKILKVDSSVQNQICKSKFISRERKEILIKMTQENVEKRFTNIYKVIFEWNRCKVKKNEGYSVSISNNAINKLFELGMIDINTRDVGRSFIIDDLSNDTYIASCKIAYNDKKSSNYVLWGNQIEYTCVIDEKTKNSFIIIAISIPETAILEMKKENFGMLINKEILIDGNKEQKMDINKLITLYNERNRREQREKEKKISNEKLIKKWTSILKIQKELAVDYRNTLRYTQIEYKDEERRVAIKIKNNIDDVEFTQDQMLVMTLKNSKGFKTARIGHFSDFKNGKLFIDAIRGIDIDIFAESGEVAIDTRFIDNIINKQEVALKKVKNKECVSRSLPTILEYPEKAQINYMLNDIEIYNEILDEDKKEIIEKAISAKDIFLLQGPPGTGKTTVISEIVIQQLRMKPDSKILISSQSNVAVNHAMNKIHQEDEDIKLVRLGRDEMITNGMEKHTIDAQANSRIEKIKIKVEKYFEHIKNKNFDKQLFDKYNLALEILEIDGFINRLDKEIFYDNKVRTEQYEVYNEKKNMIRKIKELKIMFKDIESDEEMMEEFIEEYIELGEKFIESYKEIINLEEELKRINEIIEIKSKRIDEEKKNLNSGLELLKVADIRSAIEYKENIEKKLEQQKRKLEQFSKYEKIKSEWIKKITQSEEVEKILMEEVSVVGATCIGIANYTTSFDFKFDLVIVDEAGRATPPEILVPMVLGKKIILVGDQKQLPPVVDRMLVGELRVRENYTQKELEESLFSYLEKNLNSECKDILKQQYRMTPVIGDLISKVFYDDKIISMAYPEDRNHKFDRFQNINIIWIDTKKNAARIEEKVGTTKQNTFEAREIVKLLIEMEENYKKRKISKEVAVITGYKAQKFLILRLIEMENIILEYVKIEVDTVDAFQGRETDIVIYSIVRSNLEGEIGFLGDDRRLNVSLSRAKELLILIGDSECVTQNRKNAFAKVYDYIDENPNCKIEVI